MYLEVRKTYMLTQIVPGTYIARSTVDFQYLDRHWETCVVDVLFRSLI